MCSAVRPKIFTSSHGCPDSPKRFLHADHRDADRPVEAASQITPATRLPIPPTWCSSAVMTRSRLGRGRDDRLANPSA
jgi:hypothetical protein